MNSNKHLWYIIIIVALTLSVISCGGDDNPSGGGGSTDRTPPTVVSVIPEDGDSTVSEQIVIRATMSEPLDATTVTAGALSLNPSMNGAVSYSSASRTLSFTPAQDLDTNTTYVATVGTIVRDTAGNALAAPYTWQFSTLRDHTPPYVFEVHPADNDSTVLPTAQIQAVFSEKMDVSTITNASFYLAPAVTAQVTASNFTGTLQPQTELDTFQLYEATLTTAITDSAGNPLAAAYTWSFYVVPDQEPPDAELNSPVDNAVVADFVPMYVSASDNDRVREVRFYVDDVLIAGATDSTPPYEYVYDARAWDTASVHTMFAMAFDRRGNATNTDTATVHYHWRHLVHDKEELSLPRNIADVYERSTASQIQFRVKTYNGWDYYKNAVGGIDCAFYIDTDQNPATGDTETEINGSPQAIGDIGADFRIIVGNHGDVCDAFQGGNWVSAGNPASVKAPDNWNIFEVSINRSQLQYDDVFDIVLINVNGDDYPNPLLYDWVPDAGHCTVVVDGTYQPLSSSPPATTETTTARTEIDNPFN